MEKAIRRYDVTIGCRPRWRMELWLRVHTDLFDQAGVAQLGYEVRAILNRQIPLL